MLRWIRYVATGLGLFGLVAIVALGVVIGTGVLTLEKVRRVVKYNPFVTQLAPAQSEQSIRTKLVILKRKDFNLPAMEGDLINGAGAIEEYDGGILVAERTGRIFFFRDDGQGGEGALHKTDIFLDTNDRGYEEYARSQGYAIKPGLSLGYGGSGMRLLDLLLLKDGKTLMVSYSLWEDDNRCARQHVARTTLAPGPNGPTAPAFTPIWQANPCIGLSDEKRKPFSGHQTGGRMIELSDGKVLLAIGDYKMDGYHREQSVADPGNDYGKTHLIDPVTGEDRVFSIGHRNPQGLILADTGDIWSTEHGPSGGDEVNLIVAGEDYGWPHVTLGIDCGNCPDQIWGRHDGYRGPAFAYIPSIAISGLLQIRNFAPLWDGDLLHGSLRGETLYRLRLDGRAVIYAEPIPIGDRIRDMLQLTDGRIVLWTDTGRLVFLDRDLAKPKSQELIAGLSPAAQKLARDCGECHGYDDGQAETGKINLWGIVGRRRADLPEADFSDALRAKGGVWTIEALDRFLADPQGEIPETSMPFEGVQDAALREELISFLAGLR